MNNLTEYSWYYCKMKDSDIRMLERGNGYFLGGDVPLLNNEVEQVLAEVPSYEIWQEKLKENTNLKELLYDCKIEIDCQAEYDVDCERLAKRINQVLGEE